MWARFGVGAGLGLPLSLFSVGLLAQWWPGGWAQVIVPALLLCVPLWVGIMAGSVMFGSTASAGRVLLVLNVIAAAGLWGMRHALG